jgi:hypothetical protein
MIERQQASFTELSPPLDVRADGQQRPDSWRPTFCRPSGDGAAPAAATASPQPPDVDRAGWRRLAGAVPRLLLPRRLPPPLPPQLCPRRRRARGRRRRQAAARGRGGGGGGMLAAAAAAAGAAAARGGPARAGEHLPDRRRRRPASTCRIGGGGGGGSGAGAGPPSRRSRSATVTRRTAAKRPPLLLPPPSAHLPPPPGSLRVPPSRLGWQHWQALRGRSRCRRVAGSTRSVTRTQPAFSVRMPGPTVPSTPSPASTPPARFWPTDANRSTATFTWPGSAGCRQPPDVDRWLAVAGGGGAAAATARAAAPLPPHWPQTGQRQLIKVLHIIRHAHAMMKHRSNRIGRIGGTSEVSR